jgi:hypothetical protein
MEDLFIKKLLSPLSLITPSDAFMTRSKELIAFSRQEMPLKPMRMRFVGRIFESFTFSAGLALASIMIMLALGSISYLVGAPSNGKIATSLNNKYRSKQNIDFSIQIKISYFNESISRYHCLENFRRNYFD